MDETQSKEQKKIQKSMELDVKLSEGWTSNGFHFNEKSSYNFCTLMNTAVNLGLTGIKWKKEDGSTALIQISEAKKMAGEMIYELSKLHGI
jgi:hypothetical protein